MKFRIENSSTTSICVKSRPTSFRIPASGVIEVDLPFSPKTNALISRLKREYPAIKFIELGDDDHTPAGDGKKQEDGGDKGEDNPDVKGQDEAPAGAADADLTAPVDPFVLFAQGVTSVEEGKTGGWWTVTCDGVDHKVRAKNRDQAIELAFAETQK